MALVVTKDGFPLAHRTFAGNTQDLKTVQTIVGEIETQFGTSQRIWVMDRGMISDESLKFLGESDRRYLLATKRGELAEFQADLGKTGWNRLPKNPQVRGQALQAGVGSLPAGTESAAAQEGTGDPPPPASRPGDAISRSSALWSIRESSRNGTRSLSESGD